eukprot:scaffold172_cov254-Pinguiococcus_pyrenoidosus.AAC.43
MRGAAKDAKATVEVATQPGAPVAPDAGAYPARRGRRPEVPPHHRDAARLGAGRRREGRTGAEDLDGVVEPEGVAGGGVDGHHASHRHDLPSRVSFRPGVEDAALGAAVQRGVGVRGGIAHDVQVVLIGHELAITNVHGLQLAVDEALAAGGRRGATRAPGLGAAAGHAAAGAEVAAGALVALAEVGRRASLAVEARRAELLELLLGSGAGEGEVAGRHLVQELRGAVGGRAAQEARRTGGTLVQRLHARLGAHPARRPARRAQAARDGVAERAVAACRADAGHVCAEALAAVASRAAAAASRAAQRRVGTGEAQRGRHAALLRREVAHRHLHGRRGALGAVVAHVARGRARGRNRRHAEEAAFGAHLRRRGAPGRQRHPVDAHVVGDAAQAERAGRTRPRSPRRLVGGRCAHEARRTQRRALGAPIGANVARGADGAVAAARVWVEGARVAPPRRQVPDARAEGACGAGHRVDIRRAEVPRGTRAASLCGGAAARAEEAVQATLRAGEVQRLRLRRRHAAAAVVAQGAGEGLLGKDLHLLRTARVGFCAGREALESGVVEVGNRGGTPCLVRPVGVAAGLGADRPAALRGVEDHHPVLLMGLPGVGRRAECLDALRLRAAEAVVPLRTALAGLPQAAHVADGPGGAKAWRGEPKVRAVETHGTRETRRSAGAGLELARLAKRKVAALRFATVRAVGTGHGRHTAAVVADAAVGHVVVEPSALAEVPAVVGHLYRHGALHGGCIQPGRCDANHEFRQDERGPDDLGAKAARKRRVVHEVAPDYEDGVAAVDQAPWGADGKDGLVGQIQEGQGVAELHAVERQGDAHETWWMRRRLAGDDAISDSPRCARLRANLALHVEGVALLSCVVRGRLEAQPLAVQCKAGAAAQGGPEDGLYASKDGPRHAGLASLPLLRCIRRAQAFDLSRADKHGADRNFAKVTCQRGGIQEAFSTHKHRRSAANRADAWLDQRDVHLAVVCVVDRVRFCRWVAGSEAQLHHPRAVQPGRCDADDLHGRRPAKRWHDFLAKLAVRNQGSREGSACHRDHGAALYRPRAWRNPLD